MKILGETQVDVRPALDSFSALAARAVQMPLARFMGKSSFAPLPLRPSPTMKARVRIPATLRFPALCYFLPLGTDDPVYPFDGY